MPELAEVEHSRRQWNPGIGESILEVLIARPDIRVFRDTDTGVLRRELAGQQLMESEARGKQMLFHFTGDLWLGIHLGMSGELRHESGSEVAPRKHDHLIFRLTERALIFEDKRHFGRVRLHQGTQPPEWWTALPAGVLSQQFTYESTAAFLARRKRTPVKAVLLMQEHFLGVGNWMADEILWRAGVHPAALAGALDGAVVQKVWEQVRWVSRTAMRIINDDWTYPPTWLFAHRWEAGGKCPNCQTELGRATIGGRTTCWCSSCQPQVSTPQEERPSPPPKKAQPKKAAEGKMAAKSPKAAKAKAAAQLRKAAKVVG